MNTLLTAIQIAFGSGTLVISAFAAKEFIRGNVEEAARHTAERIKRLAVR